VPARVSELTSESCAQREVPNSGIRFALTICVFVDFQFYTQPGIGVILIIIFWMAYNSSKFILPC